MKLNQLTLSLILLSSNCYIEMIKCQKRCEETRDAKTGQKGLCIRNSRCCSGVALEDVCDYDSVCCFGSNICHNDHDNNDHASHGHGHDSDINTDNAAVGQSKCYGVSIISRSQWGALRSTRLIPVLEPKYIKHIFIHHTDDGESCYDYESCIKRVRQLQSYDQINKNWPDIGYNWLVGGDGLVYEGRGWFIEGSHTINYNQRSIGIAFIGNYDRYQPKQSMVEALDDFISCAIKRGILSPNVQIHAHRDAKCTSCPGQYLYTSMRRWNRYVSGPLDDYFCPFQGGQQEDEDEEKNYVYHSHNQTDLTAN